MKLISRKFISALPLRPIAAIAMTIGIFVIDTRTDLEIAVAVFYVAVVLLSVSFCNKRGVAFVGVGCMALTILSHLLTKTGSPSAGLINSIISLSAIGITTYLALKIESARSAIYEARAQLAHIARVTSLGELTASIAHEVNQPLGAIAANGSAALRWLSSQPPDLNEAKQAIERSIEDANRASDVIARVRGLAKKAPPEKVRLNLADAIQETVALMGNEIRQNRISLRLQIADDLPAVQVDRVQLQQVMLNLIMNAIEAISAAGGARRDIVIRCKMGGENSVRVSFEDSGIGIDPARLDRLFETFYTTKPEGMGIGLAISRSIVETHGGQMHAAPLSPRGALIEFTLPIRRGTMR